MDQERHASAVIDLTGDAWLLVFDYVYLVGNVADWIRIGRVCRRWKVLGQISWESTTRLSLCMSNCTPERGMTNSDLFQIFLQKYGARLWCLDLCSFHHSDQRLQLYEEMLGRPAIYGGPEVLDLLKVPITKTAFLTLLERLPRRLTSLKLPYHNINDQDMMWAFKILQSLKSLNVSHNHTITGEFFSQAPQSLTEVFVSDCSGLTDRSVRFLAEKCPNLETIEVTRCSTLTEQSITDLARNCPKLKRFLVDTMSFAPPLNDEVIWRRESAFLTMSSLPLLEEFRTDRCGRYVTDQVFYNLGKSCPLLRSISCMACHQLTDVAIGHLSPCLHLETINLQECIWITDAGLIHLSSAHSELKEVNLCFNWCITDEGVSKLVSAHPNLLELNICSCHHVTDRVLFTLEQSLQRREHTQPLQICLIMDASINPEKAAAIMFVEKTGCMNHVACSYSQRIELSNALFPQIIAMALNMSMSRRY